MDNAALEGMDARLHGHDGGVEGIVIPAYKGNCSAWAVRESSICATVMDRFPFARE